MTIGLEAAMNVNAKQQAGFKLEPVHPKPEEAHTMPYAPAVISSAPAT
jgi:hypothetical protein